MPTKTGITSRKERDSMATKTVITSTVEKKGTVWLPRLL